LIIAIFSHAALASYRLQHFRVDEVRDVAPQIGSLAAILIPADANTPKNSLSFFGVFLFDRTNVQFSEGASPKTAKQRSVLKSMVIAICISVLFGGALTVPNSQDAGISQRMKNHGKSTEGTDPLRHFCFGQRLGSWGNLGG
jgi:hypothetical protein